MRKIPIIILSVLLAAAIIYGLVIHLQYRDAEDALLTSKKKLISMNEEVVRLTQETTSLLEDVRKNAEDLKRLESWRRRISELENSTTAKSQVIAELEEKLSRLEKASEEEEIIKATLIAESSSKDERISKLRNQLQVSESQMHSLNEEIAKGKVAIEALQHRFSELEKEKNAAEAQVQKLKSSHVVAISDLKKETKNRDNVIAGLKEELESARSQVASSREEVAGYESKIEELETQLSDLEKEKGAAEAQLEQLKSTHEGAVSELIARLRKQLTSDIPYLKEEIAKDRRETEALQRNLADLENQKHEVQALLERLKSTHEGTVAFLKEAIDHRDSVIVRLIEELVDVISKTVSAEEELEQRESKIEELKKQFSGLEKEKRALEAQVEQIKSIHEAAVTGLKKQIQNRDDTIVGLQKEFGSAKSQVISLIEVIAKKNEQIEELQGSVSDVQKEKRAAEPRAEELKSTQQTRITELKEEIKGRDVRIGEFQAELEDAKTQMTSLKEGVARRQGELETLRQTLSGLKEEKAAVETQIEQLKSTHEATVSHLNTEIQDRDNTIAGLREELEVLTSQLLVPKQEVTKEQDEIERLQAQLSGLEKKKQAAEAQVAQLKSTHKANLIDLEDQIKSRDLKIAGFQTELQDAKTQLAALKQEVANLTKLKEEIRNRDAKIAELEGQIEVTRRQAVSLKAQLAKGQSEIKGLQDRLSNLQGQRAQLITQLEELKAAHDAMVSGFKDQIQNKEVTIHELEEKLSITFVDRVLFESGRASITPEGEEILRKVGEALKNVSAKQIRVIGHTDNKLIVPEYRFKFPSNWELSAARAAAVVRYFQNSVGIDPLNMEAVGQSFYRPTASNETEEGRGLNRRVVIVIAPKFE